MNMLTEKRHALLRMVAWTKKITFMGALPTATDINVSARGLLTYQMDREHKTRQ